MSDRFEEILLGYALKISYPGSGVGKARAKDSIFEVFMESVSETSNDGSSFPSHGDGEFHKQVATLESQVVSKNKLINVLHDEKAALVRENATLLCYPTDLSASPCNNRAAFPTPLLRQRG